MSWTPRHAIPARPRGWSAQPKHPCGVILIRQSREKDLPQAVSITLISQSNLRFDGEIPLFVRDDKQGAYIPFGYTPPESMLAVSS